MACSLAGEPDHGFDLDLHAGDGKFADADQSAGRTGSSKVTLPDRIDFGPVGDIDQKDRDLQHIRKGGPGLIEHLLQVLKHELGLANNVGGAYATALIQRRDTRNEKQISEPNGIGVVAYRLAEATDTQFLPLIGFARTHRTPSPRVETNLPCDISVVKDKCIQ